mgnify:CR=1 FL=1
MIFKDDSKQNDGEETWGDNDENINADPTKGNENITMAFKLTSTAPTTVTKETMISMMTKTAGIAKTVKKEEVIMT